MLSKYSLLDNISTKQRSFRGTYDPQYYAYTFGKILIRKLKDEWLTQNSNKDLNEFHNKFLSYGFIPIPLIEEDMLRKN